MLLTSHLSESVHTARFLMSRYQELYIKMAPTQIA